MSRAFKALLFIGLVFLCAAILLTWSMLRLTIKPEPFDSAQWKKMEAAGHVSNDPGCYRGAMALGAIESRVFIGKESDKLSSLLGLPERTVENRWFYPVGQCSGDWVHSALVLTFGKDSAVLEAELKREN